MPLIGQNHVFCYFSTMRIRIQNEVKRAQSYSTDKIEMRLSDMYQILSI
jgi:hypothetical protein